jgi:hypothetical protein
MKLCVMDIGDIVYELEEIMKSWKVQDKTWHSIWSIFWDCIWAGGDDEEMEVHEQEMKVCVMDICDIVYDV